MNASTTATSSAQETTGTPIPLSYGYVWATGKRHAYYQLGEPLTTGNSDLDYTRTGIWLLGHGEWDGCIELWINDVLVWAGDTTIVNTWKNQKWFGCLDNQKQDIVFNFHRGADTIIGAGFNAFSVGPDQGCDELFPLFPPAIQPLCFSRIAYYALMRKQPIENQTNTHQNDPTQWTDINPIGLWRGLRVRIFDDEGSQTGYAFSTNPIWQAVDLWLRRRIFPDYNIDLTNGPDPLPDAVCARFMWDVLYPAAQYCDEFLANGRRRFESNISFTSATTVQAETEQLLQSCRGYRVSRAGKIGFTCDMPRSSVFTFSRAHILPGSWEATDQALSKTANRFVANFRDLLVPECSQIQSIAWPTVTTVAPHPFDPGDRIAIGGTNTPYDRQWQVKDVPAVINPGTPQEADPTTFTLVSNGENYPASVGAGGGIGLLYSRFKERSPEFWHKANMLARGAIGLGIQRARTKVKQVLDFAVCTWDQASRLTCYERDRMLGVDTTNAAGQLGSPYVTPPAVRFRVPFFARDAYGNLAGAIEDGDHITLDDTTNFQYAGEYEVLDRVVCPVTSQAKGTGGGIALTPAENSGEIEFSLGPYNEAVMYDTSDPTQAGWPSVPGSDPGNSTGFTSIPLAAAGAQFAFFTGVGASGTCFQLPSTGFPSANVFTWASPAGYLYSEHDFETIGLCDVINVWLQLVLAYWDGSGHYWRGDVNFACLTWLSADVPFGTDGVAGLKWLALTLLGGEEILFGNASVIDGDGSFTIELPAGYTTDKMFAVAYPRDGYPTGNHVHWVGAFVDSNQKVWLNYKDGEGHVWHGDAAVLVFAWKNNMGTVTTETLGAGKWMQIPLGGGAVFGAGCALGMADGAVLALPEAAGGGQTLEAMVGTSGWDYPDNGTAATGVKECYLDADLTVHIKFGNTDGLTTWPGAADIFGVYCTSGTAASASVQVSPSSASVSAGSTFQFSAKVYNNANQNVTWCVDGVVGGNLTVGTIDYTGCYAAPNTAGDHTIAATSVADPTAFGGAPIIVWGSAPDSEIILTDDSGNIIYENGSTIDVVEE